ncbi:MAG: FHA domain-containing protein [Myxococcota bacterium]
MRLIVLRGPSPAGPFDLRPGINHAGRGPECEIFLPSKRVSRRHAMFQVVDGSVEVRDLESHNGILSADGTRVSHLVLSPGERVQVGDYMLRLEGPSDDLLLEEEDDDVLLDEETAESPAPEAPAFAPAPVPAAPVAAPAPPPWSPAPPPRAAAPPQKSAAPIPPPPILPFPTAGGFGSRPGRGLPPDPSRSIVAEPDETRSDIPAPPVWMPAAPPTSGFGTAQPAATPNAGAAPPSFPAAPRPSPGPTLAPLPFGPPVGGFTTAPPPSAPPPPVKAAPPPPPPPRAPAVAPPPPARLPPSPSVRPAEPTVSSAPPSPPPRLALAPPPPPLDVEPAARAAGVPWLAQAALLVIAVVALVSCTNLLQVQGRAEAVHDVSLLRGVALTESLASRNTQALADQRGIALDTTFILDRDGVLSATIVDPRGTVRAPAERLNTSVNTSAAFQSVSTSGEPAVSEVEDGKYEIAVPMRGQAGGAGPRQIVGYALLSYDPGAVADGSGWFGVVSGLFVSAVVAAMLVAGGWWLLLRPLVALREETELALLGDSHDVASPIRLAQLEQLAHSINRVLARARAGGGSRPR